MLLAAAPLSGERLRVGLQPGWGKFARLGQRMNGVDEPLFWHDRRSGVRLLSRQKSVT